MRYDYGDPRRGLGFEHYNFYDSLRNMGHEILYFDYMSLLQKLGKDGMNRRLLEVVRQKEPNLLFSVLFTDQFEPGTFREITERTETTTLNWFCDDHWRFDNYSCHWAPLFDWVITTARSAVPKYEEMGLARFIKSQWACNHFLYRPLGLPLTHDVAFVGQPHGDRRSVIERLRKRGLSVEARGHGWESGRLSQEEMIRLFNQSRVNLNLSNASMVATGPGPEPLPGSSSVSRVLLRLPKGSSLVGLASKVSSRLRRPAVSASKPEQQPAYSQQIKGRNFEVPGCGGFLLTNPAEDLDSYYVCGKEIAVFETPDELVEKAEYFLRHEAERRAIAEAGLRRTLAEHTYVHRFDDIFRRIGLESPSASDILAGKVRAGETIEVE